MPRSPSAGTHYFHSHNERRRIHRSSFSSRSFTFPPDQALPSGRMNPTAVGSQSRPRRKLPRKICPCLRQPHPAPDPAALPVPVAPTLDRKACLHRQSPTERLSNRFEIRFASGTAARFHRNTRHPGETTKAHGAPSIPSAAPLLLPSLRCQRSFPASCCSALTTQGGAHAPPCQTRNSDGLKESHRLSAVADQQILGLLIVVENHFVRLAPEAGLLVSAECRARRIHVVTVRPTAAGLYLPAHAI